MKKANDPRLDRRQGRVQDYFERHGPQRDPEEAQSKTERFARATPRGDDDDDVPEV
jgi:hypothetical protein